MNEKRGNPYKPFFVFKSSKLGAKLSLNMTEEDHILNKEFCTFDGRANRYKGLVTITASVYHPITEYYTEGSLEEKSLTRIGSCQGGECLDALAKNFISASA